jgi:hypothetical protein
MVSGSRGIEEDEMRSVLQLFAGLVLAVGALGMFIGLLALVNDPPERLAANTQIFESIVGLVLFAAILWMLVDIARALQPAVATPDEAYGVDHVAEHVAGISEQSQRS